MTALNTVSGRPQPARHTSPAGRPPLTLADEHVLLLEQVTVRAAEVLAAASDGRWPAGELASLVGYTRAEVLRQVSDEEALLFPEGSAPAATRLAHDHARLRASAELLAQAATGEEILSPGQLAAATRDFVDQLEYHMSAEEKLLGYGHAPHSTPAAATLGGHPHTWYPLTEGPMIDLDTLPAGQAIAAAVDRLLRLPHGEQAEIRSSADISPVWRELGQISPGGYQFAVLEDGPERWRMTVTRHQAP